MDMWIKSNRFGKHSTLSVRLFYFFIHPVCQYTDPNSTFGRDRYCPQHTKTNPSQPPVKNKQPDVLSLLLTTRVPRESGSDVMQAAAPKTSLPKQDSRSLLFGLCRRFLPSVNPYPLPLRLSYRRLPLRPKQYSLLSSVAQSVRKKIMRLQRQAVCAAQCGIVCGKRPRQQRANESNIPQIKCELICTHQFLSRCGSWLHNNDVKNMISTDEAN